MNDDYIAVGKVIVNNCQRFRFWLMLRSERTSIITKHDRKNFISFAESFLGPIGKRWQYQRYDIGRFILKIDNEQDAVFFLLKFKST
jgi:hypothetical protein